MSFDNIRNHYIFNKNWDIEKSIKQINYANHILGFFFFNLIIIFVIPSLLYKFKLFFILSRWMPNLDLIATVLTWWRGPFDIFRELYRLVPLSKLGISTQIFINYLSLLALVYICIEKSVKNKNIYAGWSNAFIMLIVTYLIPSLLITDFMNNLSPYIQNKNWVALLGILSVLIIIIIESIILEKFDKFGPIYIKSMINFLKKTLS